MSWSSDQSERTCRNSDGAQNFGNSMSSEEYLASIIVPMRNAEAYISATLISILQERQALIEVIVVDDNSADRSAERVQEFRDPRIRLIRGHGRGIAAAMNIGLTATRGPIVMCCDADDLYPAMRIRQQVAWLQKYPDFDGVCGNFSTIDAHGNLIAEMGCGHAAADITSELSNGRLRTHLGTYAVRSPMIQRLNGFREFFESAQDLDFQLRLGEVGRIAYVPQQWYLYRLHASSITHTQPDATRRFFEQKAYELQKQRQENGVDELQRGQVPQKPTDDWSPPYSAKRHVQGQLLGRAWQEHRVGKKTQALRTGARALAADPLQMHVWRSMAALILKSHRRTSS